MPKQFGVAFSSLTNGYAVTFVPSEEFDEAIGLASYHAKFRVTECSIFLILDGDDEAEGNILDTIDNELCDFEITDNVFAVDTSQILTIVENLVTQDDAHVFSVSGTLLEPLRSEYPQAYQKILTDIRRSDAEVDARLVDVYAPYIEQAKSWFTNDPSDWRQRLVDTVYRMNSQSKLDWFSSDYRWAQNQIESRLKGSDAKFLCPSNMNPYIIAISAFGYHSEYGLLYIACCSIANSTSDKTKRENWSDLDLGVYAALQVSGGALEAMAFRYGFPPHSQDHQKRLIPFHHVIPGGVRFYENVGIRSYLQERYPHISYQELKVRNRPLEVVVEIDTIRMRYRPMRETDYIYELLNP